MDKFNFNPKLRNGWLVQRLHKPAKPAKGTLADFANTFSFGGGLLNGGISKEGMTVVRQVFSFDYMGSSEFEWGIVPSTLQFIAKNIKDFVNGAVTTLLNGPDVYYICHKDHVKDIEDYIKTLATNPPRAKEAVMLNTLYHENSRYKTNCVGWLDCTNGLMFFVDADMYKNTCKLLGIK